MSNVFPMHPPGCGCGGCSPPCPPEHPGMGWWGNRLRDCWKEVEWFKQLIRDIIAEGVVGGQPLPIPGNTTGKPAAAGFVGEYLRNTVAGTFLAPYQIQSVAALIVSAGDWDVQAEVNFGGVAGAAMVLTGALMYMPTVAPGVSGDAFVADPRTANGLAAGTVTPADTNGWASLVGPRFQACVSAPTLIAFQLATNLGAGTGTATAGTFNFITTARRMR
jgi:hypothetical protein